MRADYEKIYYIMCDAAERAMNILISAQQQCEDIYLSATDEEPKIIPFQRNDTDK